MSKLIFSDKVFHYLPRSRCPKCHGKGFYQFYNQFGKKVTVPCRCVRLKVDTTEKHPCYLLENG